MKHYRSRSNLRRSRKPKSRNNRRRRTYRYRGGAPAGTAAAEIVALNAAFTAALGNEQHVIRTALGAVNRTTKDAQRHMASLLGQIRDYDKNTIVTAAMLATDKANVDAAAAAARDTYLNRHVHGHRPNALGDPYQHSGIPRSGPAGHASPTKQHPR